MAISVICIGSSIRNFATLTAEEEQLFCSSKVPRASLMWAVNKLNG